ncbi:HesA/MoeB/ThiF family protein [Pseudonocardia benzenivorans]
MQRARLLLVGAGSIGSAVADALALYGIGHLVLVDPDRLRWHNLVRHRARPSDVGKYKVVALRDDLAVTRPATEVKPLTWNVVTDADRVRALLNDIDVVVCCADGVAPRRVVSHLARRARKPAVLSCVLEDGAVGEVMRLQPWTDHGCLNCRREALQECGGIDPEPALDARYGTGSTHRPMTAVGGDLHLVGQLTASIAVSTVLARAGSSGHRLPGEHLAVGLRTTGELAAPSTSTVPLTCVGHRRPHPVRAARRANLMTEQSPRVPAQAALTVVTISRDALARMGVSDLRCNWSVAPGVSRGRTTNDRHDRAHAAGSD